MVREGLSKPSDTPFLPRFLLFVDVKRSQPGLLVCEFWFGYKTSSSGVLGMGQDSTEPVSEAGGGPPQSDHELHISKLILCPSLGCPAEAKEHPALCRRLRSVFPESGL